MRTLSRLGRTAGAVIVAAGVAGCAAMLDPRGAQDTAEGVINSDAPDRAMSALAKGDYPAAERHALLALRYNPKDPTALLVAGMAYQGMGRYDLARQYYEVIITNQTPGTIMAPGDGGTMMPRSVTDIARANLASVDKITGRNVPRSTAQAGRTSPGPLVNAPPFPTEGMTPMDRPLVAATPLEAVGPHVSARVSDAETNVSGRFRILKRLYDEGLVTPEEYNKRRAANMGALLPFTAPTPSTGLERPIPGDEAVVTRLRDLAATLETRAITPAQLASERAIILDNLLPEKPRKVENPPLPPKDLLEAGQAVGRLERLRAVGLVSDSEMKKERDAIERSLDVQLNSQRVAGTATGLRQGAPGSAGVMAPAGAKAPTGWGVALASAKSEDAARKTWAGIKAKFPEQLGKLDAAFKKVGDKWKVIAGPLDGKPAAQKLCKTLKLHRQACDPANM